MSDTIVINEDDIRDYVFCPLRYRHDERANYTNYMDAIAAATMELFIFVANNNRMPPATRYIRWFGEAWQTLFRDDTDGDERVHYKHHNTYLFIASELYEWIENRAFIPVANNMNLLYSYEGMTYHANIPLIGYDRTRETTVAIIFGTGEKGILSVKRNLIYRAAFSILGDSLSAPLSGLVVNYMLGRLRVQDVGEIDQQFKDDTYNALNHVLHGIKENVFYPNFLNCQTCDIRSICTL